MLPFRALFPLEYGGLKPILPFLEDRSDAACRVVIKAVDPHGRHGMRMVVAMDGIWNAKRHATAIPPFFADSYFSALYCPSSTGSSHSVWAPSCVFVM